MADLQTMVHDVKMLVGEPRPQAPSNRTVFKALLRTVQSAFNQLNNTNHAWTSGEWVLTVVPGIEDYQVTPADFGKPLSVTTQDLANPAHIERLVDFFEIQNINTDWGLPNDAGSWTVNWDGSQTTALRIAFFRKSGDNQTWIRIKPIPQFTAQYRIMYSIGNWIDTAALNSSPLLSEHHHLFVVRTALHVLPLCSWWDDENLNRERRRELMMTLKDEEAIYAVDWSRYIGNLRHDHISTRFVMSID